MNEPSSKLCRKAPMALSIKCCCKRRAFHKIPQQAVKSMSATSTPMCQYRINGITLPDGISGFGHVLDTGLSVASR